MGVVSMVCNYGNIQTARKYGGKLLRRVLCYAFLFKQTGGGEVNIKHKEEVDNVRVAVRCRPMNKTEIKNNNTVIVNVDQTKGEIIGIKLINTIKMSNC